VNIMVNKSKSKADTLLKQSQAKLDESIANIDSDVKDKLYIARRKAIAQHCNNHQENTISKRLKKLLPITSAALMASIVLAIFIQVGLWQSTEINIDNDLELVSTLDNIELYDDLEFYQWLAEEDLQTG